LEKIIFLVCVLVTAGAVAWVFLGKSGESVEAVIPSLPNDFEPYPYEGMEAIRGANWSAPEFQDSEEKWLFRVFTPPKIYLENGILKVEPTVIGPPPPPPPPPTPFGVRFAEIVRDKYRLQLDAIYETELDNVDSALLSFQNVYAGLTDRPTVTLKKGETSEQYEFRVEDIRKEERRDEGGGLETEHIATITDLRTGNEVVLSDLTTLYDEGRRFRFESTENPGQTATVESIGDTFRMNDATYTLVTINLEAETVEVVKEADYLDVPEQETLSLSPSPSPGGSIDGGVSGDPEPSTDEEPEDDGAGFDSDFFN